METLIKLKTKVDVITQSESSLIYNKFYEACVNLDAGIIEPYISEDTYFQDLDKYRFLADLKARFDRTKAKRVFNVYVKKEQCLYCKRGCLVDAYYSSHLEQEFAYMIEKEDDIIKDIYVCNMPTDTKPFEVINLNL